MVGTDTSPSSPQPSAAPLVAVYARVTTGDQSCEPQLRDLRDYCRARAWEAVEYVDQGHQGAGIGGLASTGSWRL